MSDDNNKQQQYGVVLYYKYTTITNLDYLVAFYESNCTSLGLLGRVRLASHGVNVTIGGKLSDVEKHIRAVKENSLFDGTDFKLASCHQPLDDKVAQECGFTSLSVRKVKELVTFSCHPLLKSPEVGNAGRHLSAAEFHSVLQSAGKQAMSFEASAFWLEKYSNYVSLCSIFSLLFHLVMDIALVSRKVIIECPTDVKLMPAFILLIAHHADQGVQADSKNIVLLDARNVYETRIGKFDTPNVETLDPGIRQYSDLPAWIDNNSEQLQGKQILMYCTGGIRCEMASAYIKSKGAGFEDVFQLYGGIQRYLEQFPDGGFFKGKNFVFDHRISVGSSDTSVLGTCLLCGLTFDDYSPRCRCSHCRMLVLVCDGCRMNNDRYVCELCQKHGKGLGYVPTIENGDSKEKQQGHGINTVSDCIPMFSQLCGTQGPTRKLKILCLHGFRQNASSFKGRTASLAKKLKNVAELIFIDGPHELPFIYQACVTEPHQSSLLSVQELGNPPPQNCKKRFAWLVPPGFNKECADDWKTADGPFDPLQYQQQTEGFEASLAYLKSVFSDKGPFDGILGFSQGAAMTALVSTQKERLKGEIDFRFVILCSGFPVNLAKVQHGTINCPSLHIFGGDQGKDRQIANQASKQLASLYEEGSSVIIEHECGHIIPTRPPYIDEIKTFLRRFV